MEVIYVIAYDIGDDGRRELVSAILAAHGARVQLSVFECDLASGEVVQALKGRLLSVLEPREDQVRLYPLAEDAMRAMSILGERRLEERQDFWIV